MLTTSTLSFNFKDFLMVDNIFILKNVQSLSVTIS